MKRYRNSLFLNASIITFMALGATSTMAQNWADHVAVEGSMTITTPDSHTTNIQQHTDFTKVQGNASINAGHTVNLDQPSSSSKYVVYDTSADPTQILGNLNANGQVFIFDQNGVIFGNNSRVDVGSMVATTGHISDTQL
jgi:filamentous hemagglutinin family protein